MADRKYTGYHRTNKDQLPLSTLPIPPKPEHNQALLAQMKEIGDFLHQKNLHNAVQLAIEAAQGRGTLIDYFAEMGRRFGTHTAPRKEAETEALIPFAFEGHPVRVIGQNDEPWWVLTDVCEVLDIRNNRDASSRLDSDEKADVGIADTSSKGVTQRRKVTIINESGLWSLVLTSRKPEAKRFKRWLTSEVIPTIRKTGSYTLTPVEKPKSLCAPQEKRSKRRPDALFRMLKQIALDAGKTEAEAIKAAGHGVRQETGIDVLGLIGLEAA